MTAAMKLSAWQNIGTNGQPTIPGWYDAAYSADERDEETTRRFWDGSRWRYSPETGPTLFGNQKMDYRHEYWRGLAEDPNKELP